MRDATHTLTDADRVLIADARAAFATDFVYLERILWAGRDRVQRRSPTLPASPEEPQQQDRTSGPDWYRVSSKVYIDPETGCWGWTGGLSGGSSIPMLNGVAKRPLSVRRYVWQLVHGAISDSRQVKAQPGCNRLCVNPDHLRLTDGSRARTG